MKIGIPGGMLFYYFYSLYTAFFQELGAEVVTSGSTNKTIFDSGIRLCVDEACLPVKIYHGHVDSLKDKVDALFIPRIVSICKNEYICPKFCGLPEMIRNSVPNLPYVIDCTINLRKSGGALIDAILDAASIISHDRRLIMSAYKKAATVQRVFEERLRTTGDFSLSISDKEISSKKTEYARRIGIIGHPYNVYDVFINMNIVEKLKSFGYSVLFPEMLDPLRVKRASNNFPKRHFWTFGRMLLGMGLSLIEKKDVDGIIYLSSFGCGIDSLIEDYLERHIRRDGRIPYMKLVLDEHTGEAGIDTRLEAFIDMVRWKEENESYISSYGQHVRSGQGIP